MRCEGLGLTSAAAVLGDRIPLDAAIRAGHPAVADLDAQELTSVCRGGRPPHESGAEAARLAWARHPERRDDTATALILASSSRMGHPLWSAASWLGAQTVGHDRLTHCGTVNALCAGSVHALAAAARLLTTEPHMDSALIVSSDTAEAMGADRWAFDGGVTLGDGAGAAVLGRQGRDPSAQLGSWALLSVSEGAHAGLEYLQRGDAEPGRERPAPMRYRELLSQACARRNVDVAGLKAQHAAMLTSTVDRALAEAGVDRSRVDRWALPFVGRLALQVGYLEPLGIDEAASTSVLGRTTGHLGGADALVALDHLESAGASSPGALVVLVGVGGGQTCSVAVLRRV